MYKLKVEFNYSIFQLNFSTIQLFNYTTIQLFNYFNGSTISVTQLFRYKTIQLFEVFKYSTLQSFPLFFVLYTDSVLQSVHYTLTKARLHTDRDTRAEDSVPGLSYMDHHLP